MSDPEAEAVVYFDGTCGLCNGFVDRLLRWDRRGTLRYSPLQGETAAARLGPQSPADPSTIVFADGDLVSLRSTAVLRILRRLGGGWRLAAVLVLVPRPIRDAVYDWIARHRHAWFGKRAACRIPTPEERRWFLP